VIQSAGRSRTFAEFFAGMGLVRRGLEAGGDWACVYANDNDPNKQLIYNGLHGPSDFHLADVWDTDVILERLAVTSPPFLATASFPCTDLSLAGHWSGLHGKHSSAFFGFVEVLRRLGDNGPPMVMLENVPGFLTSAGGDDFRTAARSLAGLGYFLDLFLVDAKWFVPQSRPRVFLLGYKRSLDNGTLLHREDDAFMRTDAWTQSIAASRAVRPSSITELVSSCPLPTGWATVPVKPPVAVRASLSKVLDVDDYQDWWDAATVAKHHDSMQPPSRHRVDHLLACGVDAVGTAFRRTRAGKTRTEVRFDIAGCLRTPKGGSARQIVVAVEDGRLRMRWMSAAEYARLQGLPDTLVDGIATASRLMHALGDAVCVPAVQWLEASVCSPLADRFGEPPLQRKELSAAPAANASGTQLEPILLTR
jgi:DNA (cytosine-5)-methyltransferase 1